MATSGKIPDHEGNQRLIEAITGLVLIDNIWLRRPFLTWLRLAWRHKPAPRERNPNNLVPLPTGPFEMKRKQQMGDLLLWVPRSIDGLLIDDLTGRFGYSHLTVDTGEVDSPTGKPVMAEVTIGQAVERKFQDEYNGRFFSRVPLSKTGVDVETFINCINSKMGERYDDLEALTLGEIDDPAKQVCTDLATVCLPESVRREISYAHRTGQLGHTLVSVHSLENAAITKIFISPNGFARYYGILSGENLHRADVLVEPHPIGTSIQAG